MSKDDVLLMDRIFFLHLPKSSGYNCNFVKPNLTELHLLGLVLVKMEYLTKTWNYKKHHKTSASNHRPCESSTTKKFMCNMYEKPLFKIVTHNH